MHDRTCRHEVTGDWTGSNQVEVSTKAPTLQGFGEEYCGTSSVVYLDDGAAYKGIDRTHAPVKHSVLKLVRVMAHTGGMESHSAILKSGHDVN